MNQIKVLNEFFFSKTTGSRIYDANGQVVGRLKDMAVSWNGRSPLVTCIKFGKGVEKHMDICHIDQWDQRGIQLKEEISKVQSRALKNNETYVGRWLLDKQIIDLNGSKLVRVNDIKLSWVQLDDHKEVIMSAIDVGFKGLMRRLGLEFLVKNWPEQLLGWKYFTPLEKRIGNLYIKEDFSKLSQLHPADIAEIIEELGYEERRGLLRGLDDEKIADILSEVDFALQVRIFNNMDEQHASDILEEMPADDAADVLGELSKEKSAKILNLIEPDYAQEVRELMSYSDGMAGALMTTEYISFSAKWTAKETIEGLRKSAAEAETIYYIYVIDEQGVLQGVLSLRELIIAPPSALLGDLMHTKVRSIEAEEDHEKALDLVVKYNLLALPVINKEGQMLGIITVDDLLRTVMTDRSGFKTFSQYVLTARRGELDGLR